MREKPRDKGRLLHILGAINDIESFMAGQDAESFLTNKMLYFAIVKNMEIFGDASYMLTKEFRENHLETPWNDIIHMRHILVHGYYQVDSRIVWHSLNNDIPILKRQVQEYLAEI